MNNKKSKSFEPRTFVRLFQWDRIKGLKLRHMEAYCGGAAVHEGEKESLVYCGDATFIYIYSCYGRSKRDAVDEGDKKSLVYCGAAACSGR